MWRFSVIQTERDRLPILFALLSATLVGCSSSPTESSVLFSSQKSALTASTIGETNVLSIPDSGNANYLLAQSATLSQAAEIQSISFYVSRAAGSLRLGIYDASGPGEHPGSKKAATNSFKPSVGWNTVNVIVPVSLAPGNYWLAYLHNNNHLNFGC